MVKIYALKTSAFYREPIASVKKSDWAACLPPSVVRQGCKTNLNSTLFAPQDEASLQNIAMLDGWDQASQSIKQYFSTSQQRTDDMQSEDDPELETATD